jgi:hypothetical protein
MPIVTLSAIYAKIRRLTGSSVSQLPDVAVTGDPNSVGLADYINSFYNYDLPAQFRSLKLKDKYTFNTTALIDTYPFNSEQYTTVEMPVYCMKREIALFNDPWSFYGANFNWQSQTNFAFGNDTDGPYSGYTTGSPILRSVNNNPYTSTQVPPSPLNYGSPNVPGVSQGAPAYQAQRCQNILITANYTSGTCNVTDDGFGNLIGDVATNQPQGTINYQNGQISGLYFNQVIPGSNQIQVQYNAVQPTIPLGVLFYQNQFTLRPVPDRGYTIELVAYRQPTQALMQTAANGGTPELSEWWELIAFGAAKKIFEDRLDTDGIAFCDKALTERYQLAYTRTYAQLGKQRVNTIYQDQLNYNYGQGGWGFSSGSP